MGIPLRRELRAGLEPFALKNAPSFIERQFPVGRLSAEAYKERDSGQGQTLTALGSYCKGRKPLVLERAVVLGCLLPATDDPAKDLDIFLKLVTMDDEGLARRVKNLKASDIDPDWVGFADIISTDSGKPKWLQRLDDETIDRIVSEWFPTIPYERRIRYCLRPEELDDSAYASIWPEVNAHLGTDAHSLPDLVKQLGIARFEHRPKVADTFCGGGSIPFEAARVGCDVYASDLNPIACMLTWGAFNIIGASKERRAEIEAAQKAVAEAIDAEITRLGVEHDKHGNRAKAFLYCLETRCPKTGWMVPMARLVHPMNPERSGVDLKTIRGDYKDDEGNTRNRLRRWEVNDFMPRPEDIYQERLYAIQWITKASLRKGRQETFFAAVTPEDLLREKIVVDLVRKNLRDWQQQGLVPDVPIEPGDKTDEPIRTRGWTHWHHLFGPRHLLVAVFFREAIEREQVETARAGLEFVFQYVLDKSARLSQWRVGSPGRAGRAPSADAVEHVFYNQAFNTFYNYGARALRALKFQDSLKLKNFPLDRTAVVDVLPASEVTASADLFITDPPYADSIRYEEITEYFSSWLAKRQPHPFNSWRWEPQRYLAIKGKDEEFRRAMVEAYGAMTRNMPDNGLQVVMFTHQDAGV
jgi:putative DNA methylase